MKQMFGANPIGGMLEEPVMKASTRAGVISPVESGRGITLLIGYTTYGFTVLKIIEHHSGMKMSFMNNSLAHQASYSRVTLHQKCAAIT